jgi:hypothetical protein
VHKAEADNAGVQFARNNASNENEKAELAETQSAFIKTFLLLCLKKTQHKE